jgi:hypothetical protein
MGEMRHDFDRILNGRKHLWCIDCMWEDNIKIDVGKLEVIL